jgi:CheY-like chemotaxis protein
MQKLGDEVTLLLIEDDDIDVMTVERSFKKNRIANPIVRAHDGRDALEILQKKQINSPYVILLDLQMPRMNGIEFLEALRADKELAQSVVFILTTSKAEEDMIAVIILLILLTYLILTGK